MVRCGIWLGSYGGLLSLCLCKLTCSDNITSQSILLWYTVEEDGDNQLPVGDDSDSDEDGK